MGDMADQIIEHILLGDFLDEELEPDLPDKRTKWITRDGRTLSRKEMTTGHITNVIDYLSRYPSEFSNAWIRLMRSELKRRAK